MKTQKIIGRHKAEYLRKLENLSPEQKKQLQDYRDARICTPQQKFKTDQYFEEIRKPVVEKPFKITNKAIYLKFLKVFKQREGVEFIKEKKALKTLKTLILYFNRDKKFFNCDIKTKFKNKTCEPSFDKGLLIIGGFGVGKSAMMLTFEEMFLFTPYIFRGYTANNIVSLYENCENANEKRDFWLRMKVKTAYYDDVKTERIASNYGKANIFKDILEKRYISDLKTHITCNYKVDTKNDLEQGLLEFGEKYGGRIYDRLFEMFNIIEFEGKSFRK